MSTFSPSLIVAPAFINALAIVSESAVLWAQPIVNTCTVNPARILDYGCSSLKVLVSSISMHTK